MSNASISQSNSFKKIVYLLFRSLLVVFSTYPALGETASQSNSVSANVSKPLEGVVQLDERLPPASPNFAVGNTLNSQELESITPGNVWHIIPKWVAGKWHSDEEILLRVQDFHTGEDALLSKHCKVVRDHIYGEQRDKSGQIWSFDGVPSTNKAETPNGMTYFVRSTYDRGLPNDSTFVSKSRYDLIQVNNKGKIVRIAQCEQLSATEQIDDEVIKMHAVRMVFDDRGKPGSINESDTFFKRTAPYKNIDKRGERDLRKLFVEFLKQTGQEALIP